MPPLARRHARHRHRAGHAPSHCRSDAPPCGGGQPLRGLRLLRARAPPAAAVRRPWSAARGQRPAGRVEVTTTRRLCREFGNGVKPAIAHQRNRGGRSSFSAQALIYRHNVRGATVPLSSRSPPVFGNLEVRTMKLLARLLFVTVGVSVLALAARPLIERASFVYTLAIEEP